MIIMLLVQIVHKNMEEVDGGIIPVLNVHMYNLMVDMQHIPMDLFLLIPEFYG
jgi:hypothetical protein